VADLRWRVHLVGELGCRLGHPAKLGRRPVVTFWWRADPVYGATNGEDLDAD